LCKTDTNKKVNQNDQNTKSCEADELYTLDDDINTDFDIRWNDQKFKSVVSNDTQ